jgi:tetratricopeptide (TPR) repeat protein
MSGFGLPTGIALAMLALATVSIGAAADSSLPTSQKVWTEESGSKSLEDKSSPASQFLTAYNSMSLADWLKEKGLRAEAADLYTEALNLFLKVSADYPQWQPAVVSFRVNYCRTTLDHLQDRGAGGTTDDGRQTTDDNLKGTPDASQPADLSTEVYPPAAAPKATRALTKAGRQTLLRPGASEGRQQTAENQQPDSATALHPGESALSNQQWEIGNPQSAIINLSPLNFKLQQAAIKERGRDYNNALAMYIALLEEYPQEPWALKGACRCCLRLGHMDKVRELTRQALTLPLPDADLNLLAALVDCHDGHYQTAIPILCQSLKQNGACPEAHIALGVALAATGQIKEAQEEMKRALSLNPKLGDAYYNLARLSLRQKPTDHDTARVHYQNALQHGAKPDPELDKLLAE